MLSVEAALEHLPSSAAPWSEVERFCELIGGPSGDPREINELSEIVRRVGADPRAATADDLLAAVYFFWRRLRWNDGEDAEAIRAMREAIGELRHRRASSAPQ